MQIGSYCIGRYHAIIKMTYLGGSIDYETSFSSQDDLNKSVYAIRECIGTIVGRTTSNPKKLMFMSVIRGRKNIEDELLKR